MNHGIKIVRHAFPPPGDISSVPDVLHVFSLAGVSDENIVAGILCMRLIDDEQSSEAAKACRTIHVWLPFPGLNFGSSPLMTPDPKCVIKRTAALKRWGRHRSDKPLSR